MAKQKAHPMQFKFEFMDNDVNKPEHDDIAKWLYGSIQTLLPQLASYKRTWQLEDIEVESRAYDPVFPDTSTPPSKEDVLANFQLPTKPPIKIVRRGFGEQIIDHRGSYKFAVGSVDLYIKLILPHIWCSKHGRIDLCETRERHLWFLVMTEFPTLSQLLRQINLYKVYASGYWYVVAPNAKDEDIRILKEQGITFIKYTPS